mmetsp:Transcript_9640/g.22741  ORF Transcript_9640/g.22741 Transcript_9640/m.22741 type:complete len:136 (-) Transcript_9640:44-451(-)
MQRFPTNTTNTTPASFAWSRVEIAKETEAEQAATEGCPTTNKTLTHSNEEPINPTTASKHRAGQSKRRRALFIFVAAMAFVSTQLFLERMERNGMDSFVFFGFYLVPGAVLSILLRPARGGCLQASILISSYSSS